MKKNQPHIVTDIFLENEENEILMIHRAANKVVLPNYYNGLGGRMNKGETPLESVLRETKEESGMVKINNLRLRAVLNIKDKFGLWLIFIFQGKVRKKELKKNRISEGKLEWINKKDLKKIKLVPDLKHWLFEMYANVSFQFVKAEYNQQYQLRKINVNSI